MQKGHSFFHFFLYWMSSYISDTGVRRVDCHRKKVLRMYATAEEEEYRLTGCAAVDKNKTIFDRRTALIDTHHKHFGFTFSK